MVAVVSVLMLSMLSVIGGAAGRGHSGVLLILLIIMLVPMMEGLEGEPSVGCLASAAPLADMRVVASHRLVPKNLPNTTKCDTLKHQINVPHSIC